MSTLEPFRSSGSICTRLSAWSSSGHLPLGWASVLLPLSPWGCGPAHHGSGCPTALPSLLGPSPLPLSHAPRRRRCLLLPGSACTRVSPAVPSSAPGALPRQASTYGPPSTPTWGRQTPLGSTCLPPPLSSWGFAPEALLVAGSTLGLLLDSACISEPQRAGSSCLPPLLGLACSPETPKSWGWTLGLPLAPASSPWGLVSLLGTLCPWG